MKGLSLFFTQLTSLPNTSSQFSPVFPISLPPLSRSAVHECRYLVEHNTQSATPEILVDEIFGALSNNINTNTNNDGTNSSGNGNFNGANEKPAGVGGGSGNTRAALKELASQCFIILAVAFQPAFAELGGGQLR